MFAVFRRKKLLSTIVPVFNAGAYLDRCLSSVCGQQVDDHEVIVVDDNSSDDSPRILSEYQARYPSLRIISNKVTRGPGYSRNRALSVARGKYAAFIDGDDCVGERYFERLIDCADRNSSEIVFSDYRHVGEDSSRCRVLSLDTTADDARRTLLGRAGNAPWAKLYSSRFIAKHGLKFHDASFIGEDILFTWLGYMLATRVDVEPAAVYFYRLNPAGCASIADRRVLGIIDALLATRRRYERRIPVAGLEDVILARMVNELNWNYRKILPSEGSEELAAQYLHRSRQLLSGFSASKVEESPFLEEDAKGFLRLVLA